MSSLGFCSLDEAWGVPAKRVKKSTGCAPGTHQGAATNPASIGAGAPQGSQVYNAPQGSQVYNAPQGSQVYNSQGPQVYNSPQGLQLPDAYDTYSPEMGRELSLYQSQQQQLQANLGKQQVEQFVNAPSPECSSTAKSYQNGRIGGNNKTTKESEYDTNQPTYDSMFADYQFFCKKYGICMEGFENQGSTCGVSTPVIGDAHADAIKAQMAASMKASLNSDPPKPTISQMPNRVIDMSKVGGFQDEDLSNYLQISGTNTNNRLNTSFTAAPNNETLPSNFSTVSSYPKFETAKIPQQQQSTFTDNTKTTLWDIALFIATGIIIILILEQIFKIVTFIGMRQTIKILSPYLDRISKANEAV